MSVFTLTLVEEALAIIAVFPNIESFSNRKQNVIHICLTYS